MTTSLYTKALCFSAQAHDGQLRKYTGAPYIVHPLAVAEIVRSAGGCEEMIATALLHDTIEDSGVTEETLACEFGLRVARWVVWLTDVETEGNRQQRKLKAAWRLSEAPPEVQTIKVADLIHNTSNIVQHDPTFAKVYLKEKLHLLSVMPTAEEALRRRAYLQTRTSLAVVSRV